MLYKSIVDDMIETTAGVYSTYTKSDNAELVKSAMVNAAKSAIYDENGNFKDGIDKNNVLITLSTAVADLTEKIIDSSVEEANDIIDGLADADQYEYNVNGVGKRTVEDALQYAKDNGISAYDIRNKNNQQVFYNPKDTVAGLAYNKQNESPDFTSTLTKYLEVARNSSDIESFNRGLTDEFGEVVDNLSSILAQNPTLLNMWNSLQNGSTFFTFDDFTRQLNDATTGRSSFGHKQYSRMMDQLLGDNWLGQMLQGTYDTTDQSKLDNYLTLKQDPGALEYIGQLESKYTGLTEALNALSAGEELSVEQQLVLAQAFISEGITAADKYNQHIQEVVESISNLTSSSTKAKLSAIGEVFGNIQKYADMNSIVTRNRGRSGSALDSDGLAIIEEITGMKEAQIKELGVDVIELIFAGIEDEASSGANSNVGKVIAESLKISIKQAMQKDTMTILDLSSLMNWNLPTSINFAKTGTMSFDQASQFASATGNQYLQNIIAEAQARGYSGNFSFETALENGNIVIKPDTIQLEGDITLGEGKSLLDNVFTSREQAMDETNRTTKMTQGMFGVMNSGMLKTTDAIVEYFQKYFSNNELATKFLEENTGFSNLLAAASNGDKSVTVDELVKAFNSAVLGTNQYGNNDYNVWLSKIFGNNWLSQMITGNVDNSLFGKQNRQSSLNAFNLEEGGAGQLEALKKAFPELEPILEKVRKGLNLSTDEVKKLANAFILDGVKGANEFNESIDKVSETLKGLSGSAAEAITALGDYMTEMANVEKIRDITHSAEGKSGEELTKAEADFLASKSNVDVDQIRKMDAEGIGYLLNLLNQSADDSFLNYGGATMRERFLADLETDPTLYNRIASQYASNGKLIITPEMIQEMVTSGLINDPTLGLMATSLAGTGDYSFGVRHNVDYNGDMIPPPRLEAGSEGEAGVLDQNRRRYAIYDEAGVSTYTPVSLADQVANDYITNQANRDTTLTSMFDLIEAFKSTGTYNDAMGLLQEKGMT